MTWLVDVFVRVCLLVVVALAATGMLRRCSAALRHWVLAVALASAATMPGLSLIAPEWRVPLNGRPIARAPSPTFRAADAAAETRLPDVAAIPRDVPPAAPRLDIAALLAAAWAAGAAIGAIVLLVGFARLRQIAARARPLDDERWSTLTADLARDAGIRRPVTVLRSDHPALLVTWGVVRPKIVLPADARAWPADRVRVVLRHELAHIARGDWLMQIVAEFARTLHWFNPVMWIACRVLRRESELACDDAVLKGGVGAEDYASHLVDLARAFSAHRRPLVPAPGMARASDLERRISIMLTTRQNRNPITRRGRLATAVVLIGAAMSVAGARAQRFSTFSGTLTDQTNAVLPNVAVAVANAAAQTRHEVRTDRTGHFELPGLPDGDYQVVIDEPGFSAIRETVSIVGRDVTRAFQMQLGNLQETINITSGGPASAPDLELRAKARQWAEQRMQKVAERCGPSGDAAAAAAGNIGGNIMQPAKIADVKPRYPENLQAARVGGVVTLEALIGTDGTIRDVHVVEGDPDLGAAAADAIRQWEFSPTYLNCTPVEVRMGVTARFVVK